MFVSHVGANDVELMTGNRTDGILAAVDHRSHFIVQPSIISSRSVSESRVTFSTYSYGPEQIITKRGIQQGKFSNRKATISVITRESLEVFYWTIIY